jgi:hypothetical protein
LVNGLTALVKRIQDSGYEIDISQPPLDGYTRVHVSDPFGSRLELTEITNDKQASNHPMV